MKFTRKHLALSDLFFAAAANCKGITAVEGGERPVDSLYIEIVLVFIYFENLRYILNNLLSRGIECDCTWLRSG
jgi:hypothetical protein